MSFFQLDKNLVGHFLGSIFVVFEKESVEPYRRFVLIDIDFAVTVNYVPVSFRVE